MQMSYTPFYTGGWQSGETGGTPITPAALNHMEQGISNALPNTGGDATGNIRVKKQDPYFSLFNTQSGDILGLHYYGGTTGKNTFGIYDHANGTHLVTIDQATGVVKSLHGGFDANGNKVTNVAWPEAQTDAATRAYAEHVGLISRYPGDIGVQSDRVTADNIDSIDAQGIFYTEMDSWCQTIVFHSSWAVMQIQFNWAGKMRSRIKWGGNWSAWNE